MTYNWVKIFPVESVVVMEKPDPPYAVLLFSVKSHPRHMSSAALKFDL